MNLEFAYESRDTVQSFSLIVFVKTISTLNMEHGVKSEKKNWIRKLPVSAHVVKTTQNVDKCHFADDGGQSSAH